MVINYPVVWSARAKNNLHHIIDYKKNKESVERAVLVRNGLLQATQKASIYPTKHKIEPNYNRTDIRFAVKWHFKIVFQITGNRSDY